MHEVLLLNQHDEFRHRFKDVLALQDGVALRWGGEDGALSPSSTQHLGAEPWP